VGWSGRKVTRARAIVLAFYGPTCWLCGKPITNGQPWDIDHVRPRSAGGSDTLGNLRPAHASCNRGRGARPARGPASWPL